VAAVVAAVGQRLQDEYGASVENGFGRVGNFRIARSTSVAVGQAAQRLDALQQAPDRLEVRQDVGLEPVLPSVS